MTRGIYIEVRLAEAGDLAFVSADGHVPPERVALLIDQGGVYVGLIGGEPVGYARVEHLWSKVPYLSLIRILEPHRRLGVGRAILAAIERDMASAGHTYFYSSATANEPPPQDWHRRMGFSECGYIAGINASGVGEIFFRKPLVAG